MSGPRIVGSLAPIVRALGGDLYEGGRRALVPGPGHGPEDRSVSLLLSGGRVVVHCFAGDDWRAVVDDLRRQGLLDPGNRPIGAAGLGATGLVRPSVPERMAVAAALWGEGRAIAGDAAARHLRLRAVRRPGSPALRFHPQVPQGLYRGRGPRHPALLAAIQDAAGRLVGVEVTYLEARGALARVAVPRKTIGRRPAGSAVRLDPAGSTLLVGEGVFSSLSAGEALGLPAWALLAVGNLRAWSPPAEARRVVIAADRGEAGLAGAAVLARRLRAQGLSVAVRPPPRGFGDWNDWARARAEEEGGGGESGT